MTSLIRGTNWLKAKVKMLLKSIVQVSNGITFEQECASTIDKFHALELKVTSNCRVALFPNNILSLCETTD